MITQSVVSVSTTNALLNITVHPQGATGALRVAYGLTTNYGSLTPGQNLPQSLSLALEFNGVNQSASTVTPLTELASGNAPHTIEAWLRPTLAPTGREWPVLLDGPHPGAHHWLISPDGTSQIGSYAGTQVTPTFAANVWTHLAAAFDGTTLRVYTNGMLAGSVASSFNFTNFGLLLAQKQGDESFYAGGMAQLRIWNTARTQAEIQGGMAQSLTGSNRVAGYALTNNGTVSDESGHGHARQTQNAPAVTNGPGYFVPKVVPFRLTGLVMNTPYHCRAEFLTSTGTVWGADQTFTTTNQPAFGLQYKSDLQQSNWTSLYGPARVGNFFTHTQALATNAPARFFRLVSPCGDTNAPRLRDGRYIQITSDDGEERITTDVISPGDRTANTLTIAFNDLLLDASQFIDPRDCNSTVEDLNFNWKISTPTIAQYTVAGITGYQSPRLFIRANSLLRGFYNFELVVTTKRAPVLTTTVTILANCDESELTVNIFNACQSVNTCDYPCLNTNALPAPGGTTLAPPTTPGKSAVAK